MLTYLPLSQENLEEASGLVRSVFPDDFNSEDSPYEAYRASLDSNTHKDFILKHDIDYMKYFVVKDFISENIIGVTGWYTQKSDDKDVVWLGWYCLDPKERGKGLGKEILIWTMNRVRELGYKVMKLYTSTDPNEATAQILYEKLGFKIVDEELKEGEIHKTLYRECIL
ncbi:GNAT family N-acetyltransferase [Candidatus Gracilibacteria bacterium]|nr:GNAT family N-acetyltransferase [Candidatus Gracilibacteria bacterium]MCF7898910.1 GNAT family N-acetyltransferase [Candidatus Paceibacterota bacterium]